jgi:nucleotide-binding universal stress UspA family protein
MTYKTLMVHLNVGRPNKALLRVTCDLVNRFDAKVIGVVGCHPTTMVYGDGVNTAAIVATDRTEIKHEIKAAEAEFHAAFEGTSTAVEWRSSMIYESVADYVSRECHSADLIITSGLSRDPKDTARAENPGDIVMQAGRPVLIVPHSTNMLKLDQIVVAWKNTREARRAITDALPMMKHATRVTVLEIADAEACNRVSEQLADICAWLKSHDIDAKPEFVARSSDDDVYQLDRALEKLDAQIVVAGAYGHSRLREWALGGVTRDLMLRATYCTLLSH